MSIQDISGGPDLSAPADAPVEDVELTQARAAIRRGAMFRIGIGVLLLVVGLAMMASGTETSGRRSPAGAIVAGLVATASGIYELAKVEGQSLQRRVDEALK